MSIAQPFRCLALFLALLVLVLVSGCAHYMTPGAGVSIPAIADSNIDQVMARKPAASFPAHLVAARIQASGYESASNRGYGRGRYSVVTVRDIETEADFSRLGALEGVAALGPLNRILLPENLQSIQDLREAAAQLRGDILLVYTLDTSFHTEAQKIGPLQLVSLGFFPNQKSHVTTTCSAAFIDVRTGYLYGIAEATATETQRSDLWSTQSAIDTARLKAERAAFAASVDEIAKTWASINREYGHAAGTK